MKRYPDQQSILEEILKSVDSGKTIRSIDVNQRDASLYKEASTSFGGYYAAIEAAAAIRREELPDFRREQKRRKVNEHIRRRWLGGKSIHPDQLVREEWNFYWDSVVVFGSYEQMLAQTGYDAQEVLSRRLWPKTQVGMALKRLHDKGEDMSATNMQAEHKALHTAARRAYGTYENALAQNGISYDEIRRNRKVTRETVIEEMIALARSGKDMRMGKICNDSVTMHLQTNTIDHFGSYRNCISEIYTILVARGDKGLADRFDFRKMQLRTTAERMARRKRKNKDDIATIHARTEYTRESLEASAGQQLHGDINEIFGRAEKVNGTAIRTYFQMSANWALPSRLERLLGCSDDTIKRHRIFWAKDAVVRVMTGQMPEYYINTKYLHLLSGKIRKIDAAKIDPDREYSIVEISKMLHKSRAWISAQLGTPKDRSRKKVPGQAARTLAMRLIADEARYSLSEAGRAIGISEKRVRDFVNDKKVVPISDRPLILDEQAIQKLEDLIVHEKRLVQSWTESINPGERYGYHQLIMLGLPLSSVYKARRDGKLDAIEEDGAARFSGEGLLNFIKRYNPAHLNRFTRGIFLKEATLYTPEEIVRLTGYQLGTVRDIVQELIDKKKAIVLHAGELRHYLVEKDILYEHLYGRQDEPAEPAEETPAQEFTSDPLVLQYVEMRDSKRKIEGELDLSMAAVIAVMGHMKRGTYSHITKKKTLTSEEFMPLAMGLAEDRALRQLAGKLLGKYERMIAGAARRYYGANQQDLVQEGRMEFLSALDSYDPKKSGFVNYAKRRILRKMTKFAHETSEDIKTPDYMFSAERKVREAEEELGELSPAEIGDAIGLRTKTVERVRKGHVRTKSMHTPVRDGDDRTIEDFLPSDQEDPEQIQMSEEKRNNARQILELLNDKEREVLIKRLYEGKTLEQAGEEMGFTREYVRQVQEKAIAKLKKRLGNKFKDFS